jgi:hypothetical protein
MGGHAMNPREKPQRLLVPNFPCMVFLLFVVNDGSLLATANPTSLSRCFKADTSPVGG